MVTDLRIFPELTDKELKALLKLQSRRDQYINPKTTGIHANMFGRLVTKHLAESIDTPDGKNYTISAIGEQVLELIEEDDIR